MNNFYPPNANCIYTTKHELFKVFWATKSNSKNIFHFDRVFFNFSTSINNSIFYLNSRQQNQAGLEPRSLGLKVAMLTIELYSIDLFGKVLLLNLSTILKSEMLYFARLLNHKNTNGIIISASSSLSQSKYDNSTTHCLSGRWSHLSVDGHCFSVYDYCLKY